MKILLSFYPDFKITQLSDHTARMWLSNEYDLFIDVNANPGSWTAQRKRGTLRNDLMLRGGKVPADDVAKADALITRYNEALVTHVMEVEGREKDGIKKDIEVLKWHKKPRGQLEQDKRLEFNVKGSTDLENIPKEESKEAPAEKVKEKVTMPMVLDLIQHGLKPAPADPAEVQERKEVSQEGQKLNSVSDPALEEADKISKEEENQEGEEVYIFTPEEWAAIERLEVKEALPEEPNLEEIQEAPVDPEGEEEVQALPGPIISPLAYQEYKSKGFDIEVPNNYSMWISEKICPQCSGYLYLQHSGFSEPVIICGKCKNIYYFIDLDRLPDRKKEEAVQTSQPEEEKKPYRHPLGPGYYALTCHPLDPKFKNLVSPGEAADLNTWDGITEKIIKDMDAAKLQPGEDYDEKIEAKALEIFEALDSEIRIAQTLAPESKDKDLDNRLSMIYEKLEVLQLLYSAQRLQYLRDFANLQRQEPAEDKQEPAAELNEVFLLKNSKGYSWKITARAASMEEAIKSALLANDKFKEQLKNWELDSEKT